jgi:hypothetical protein
VVRLYPPHRMHPSTHTPTPTPHALSTRIICRCPVSRRYTTCTSSWRECSKRMGRDDGTKIGDDSSQLNEKRR